MESKIKKNMILIIGLLASAGLQATSAALTVTSQDPNRTYSVQVCAMIDLSHCGKWVDIANGQTKKVSVKALVVDGQKPSMKEKGYFVQIKRDGVLTNQINGVKPGTTMTLKPNGADFQQISTVYSRTEW